MARSKFLRWDSTCTLTPSHSDGGAGKHGDYKDRQRHRRDYKSSHKAPHQNREGTAAPWPPAIGAEEAASALHPRLSGFRIPTQKTMRVDRPKPSAVRAGASFRHRAHFGKLGLGTDKALLCPAAHRGVSGSDMAYAGQLLSTKAPAVIPIPSAEFTLLEAAWTTGSLWGETGRN